MSEQLPVLTTEDLEAELSKVQAKIDDAYWRFTRCAKADPPSMVVPEAYKRRAEIRAELRQRRRRVT